MQLRHTAIRRAVKPAGEARAPSLTNLRRALPWPCPSTSPRQPRGHQPYRSDEPSLFCHVCDVSGTLEQESACLALTELFPECAAPGSPATSSSVTAQVEFSPKSANVRPTTQKRAAGLPGGSQHPGGFSINGFNLAGDSNEEIHQWPDVYTSKCILTDWPA